VLKFGDRWRFPVEAALHLHTQLLNGKVGYVLVLVTGLLLTLMAGTGIVFWWPRSGSWRSRLVVNFRHPFKAVIRSVHRTTGICLSPLLLMMAVTGMILAAELVVTTAPSSPSGDIPFDTIRDERISDIVALATAHFPKARVRDIRFANDRPATVQLWEPGTERWSLHRVVINAERTEVVDVVPAADNKALWMALLPFHTGSVLGLGGRIVITVVGFALLSLTIMGLVLWFTKPGRSRKRRDTGTTTSPGGKRSAVRAGTKK
jgi:uncharacterized iron-regulated membrane protein